MQPLKLKTNQQNKLPVFSARRPEDDTEKIRTEERRPSQVRQLSPPTAVRLEDDIFNRFTSENEERRPSPRRKYTPVSAARLENVLDNRSTSEYEERRPK